MLLISAAPSGFETELPPAAEVRAAASAARSVRPLPAGTASRKGGAALPHLL